MTCPKAPLPLGVRRKADFSHDGAHGAAEGLGDGVGRPALAQAVLDAEAFLFGEAGFVHGVFLLLAGGGIAAGLERKTTVMGSGVSKSKCALPHGGGGRCFPLPIVHLRLRPLPVRLSTTRRSQRLASPLSDSLLPR